MKIILHSPSSVSEITDIYKQAFSEAVRLYVVSAYLTEWDISLQLNDGCKKFRVIVGKDFGITKKSACLDLMKWLSAERKSQFMVADAIDGFHPKAIFWMDKSDNCFSLIGSSNLTKAAFHKNYEANIFSEISKDEFIKSEEWIKEIEDQSVVVSEDWLGEYQEAKPAPNKNSKHKYKGANVITLKLPNPSGSKRQVAKRRVQLTAHDNLKDSLKNLFLKCRDGNISSSEFYDLLPSVWSWDSGNRLQGSGWERQGKGSNFKEISTSFINILNAKPMDRDDIVVKEIDKLKAIKSSARRAFFSEILCLTFPDKYPVLNKPVKDYIKDIGFRAPKGASEGARYLDLAKKLRTSLAQNPKHPANNLAELDTVIWLAYGE
ncbi:phospholipase D family protein [Alteromonas stellipolaris]|uniref:phospholipase D family protein n=1 Tax=Alteromonas stellipolaris TaxID=233316 RepID=UPI0026E450CC|nr:phospholipase D family protein [Alteromonas stellipolaris]MDO6537959.1 phospholipase D family protein [Alteromonas stellipolaris]